LSPHSTGKTVLNTGPLAVSAKLILQLNLTFLVDKNVSNGHLFIVAGRSVFMEWPWLATTTTATWPTKIRPGPAVAHKIYVKRQN